jgi:hypothetical protein
MSDIEPTLHAALDPKQPAPGFTERVMERVKKGRRAEARSSLRVSHSFRRFVIPAAIAAALLLAVTAGLLRNPPERTPAGGGEESTVSKARDASASTRAVTVHARPVQVEKRRLRSRARSRVSRRHDAEAAKRQLLFAINIAAAKLHRAQELALDEE